MSLLLVRNSQCVLQIRLVAPMRPVLVLTGAYFSSATSSSLIHRVSYCGILGIVVLGPLLYGYCKDPGKQRDKDERCLER